jgi:hypothetical protein
MASKSNAAAPGPTARRCRQPASTSVRQGNVTGRLVDPALCGPQAKALKVASSARKNVAPGKLVQRLVDIGLRLHALRDSNALCASLIDETAQLTGAQRVLLVLNGPHGLRIAGSLLPRGESPIL